MKTLEQHITYRSRGDYNALLDSADRMNSYAEVKGFVNEYERAPTLIARAETSFGKQDPQYTKTSLGRFDPSNYQHTKNDIIIGTEEPSSFGKAVLKLLEQTERVEIGHFYSNPDSRALKITGKYTEGNVAGKLLEKIDEESDILVNAAGNHNAEVFGSMAEREGANVTNSAVQVHSKASLSKLKDGRRAQLTAAGNLSRSVFLDKGSRWTDQMAQINLGVITFDEGAIGEFEQIHNAITDESPIPETHNYIVSGPGQDSHRHFVELLETAEQKALIFSPFIDSRVMQKQVSKMARQGKDVTIVTNPVESLFTKGAGGHKSGRLEFLAQSIADGVNVYSVAYDSSLNYHTKGIAVDTGVGTIGSDNYTNKTNEGRSIETSKVGLYAEEMFELFDRGRDKGDLVDVMEAKDPSAILIQEMVKGIKFRRQGVSNAHYVQNLASASRYFTLSASRGTSQHYQQSLYENMMKQGGYRNLAKAHPFEGVAESMVKTNTKLLFEVGTVSEAEAGAGTLFLAKQFDKGLYQAGLGEFLNNKLFIPNGFGRAYKDEKGFISSMAGFAGRMLDESYLYYSNINPDIHLIGNEYETGQGLGPMTADRPGLFESTFSRAADYTVAMAQSLGMYIAITQPIEMLKASVYKDVLDTSLTSASRSVPKIGTQGRMLQSFSDKAANFLRGFTRQFFFGDLSQQEILHRMFEIDDYNNTVKDINGVDIKVKQTAFFDHNEATKSGFSTQQFLTRGRAEMMLNSTFKPFLKEVVNPYDISAINKETGMSYYKQFNNAVDELIDAISAPAGLAANFEPGNYFTFKNSIHKGSHGAEDFYLIVRGGTPTSSNNTNLIEVRKTDVEHLLEPNQAQAFPNKKSVSGLEVIIGKGSDSKIDSYPELKRQYTKINDELTKRINAKYQDMASAKTVSARNKAAIELGQLMDAKDGIERQLGEAFELMSLESKNMGVGRKRGIAKALQGVLDYMPLNPFKWGILGGNLQNNAGTVMIGQLFSFEDTARMAEAAVTGDGSLNQLFRQAQTSKLATMRREQAGDAEVTKYIRTYDLTDTVHASMKTFDNLNGSIFRSIKDFIRPDPDSQEALIATASKQLRKAELKTVNKKGFVNQVVSNFFGNFEEIDAEAMSVDKTYLHVRKRGSHILSAIADYDEQLSAKYGIDLNELERHLDTDGTRRLMRNSGEMNIQRSINAILQGKGSNLQVEGVINKRAKGLIAGLVFASIAANSIFQSTGGASLITQAAFAVAGEQADIAVEFEGNRFLPTELVHSGLENVFGATPSLLAINTTSEIGFIAGSLYLGRKLAQKHVHYEKIQYSYTIQDIRKMQEAGEHVVVKKLSNIKGKVYETIDLTDVQKATRELAEASQKHGKVFIETLSEGTRGKSKFTQMTVNGTADILTSKQILQTVVKDVPINTMIYASIAMLGAAGLREVAAGTLQTMSQMAGDPGNLVNNFSIGAAVLGTIIGATYAGATYVKGRLVDDIMQAGESQARMFNHYNATGKIAQAETRLEAINKRITQLQDLAPDPRKPLLAGEATKNVKRLERIKKLKRYRGKLKSIVDLTIENEAFKVSEAGIKYTRLIDPTNRVSRMLRNFSPKKFTAGVAAIGTIGLTIGLYQSMKDKELDYSGSLDPLLGAAVGLGVGSLLARSPAVAVMGALVGAGAAYLANFGGLKLLKIGKSGEAVDEDTTRMISQLGEFTSAVSENLGAVDTFTVTTSAYVSEFTNLADKGLYGKGENAADKTRVIAKQVPLPFMQFFVAEKISGDYNTGLGEGFDNTKTSRIYSVGVQTGALFGMSMSLQLPVMYTPGRGFAGFSYNKEHNLDKLPNALATIAAHSNVFFGGLAAVSGLGAMLPGNLGKTLKNFSTSMGGFNEGVQNLTRNVNGFYIEQVSRTFTRLNLIDTQLILQSVGDAVYDENRFSKMQTEVRQEIDNKIVDDFKNGKFKAYAKDGVTEIPDSKLNLKDLSDLAKKGELDEVTKQQIRGISEGVRAEYYETHKLNVVEKNVINRRVGQFGVDVEGQFGTGNKAGSRLAMNFLRRNAFGMVKMFTVGAAAANLIGKAIHTAKVSHVGKDEEGLRKAEAQEKLWESRKIYWQASGGILAAAGYVGATSSAGLIHRTGNFLAQREPARLKAFRHSNRVRGVAFQGLMLAAIAGYHYLQTSEEFGFTRNMDRHIAYSKDGNGALKTQEQNLIYEKSLWHQGLVVGLSTAYTAGMFYAFGGPADSYSKMSQIFFDDFEGKTPTSVVGKIWETIGGGQRKRLAKLEIENLLGDVSRLQFNDLDEFKAFHNLDVDTANPVQVKRLAQQSNLYELKQVIRERFATQAGIDIKDVPQDFVHKYIGLHKEVKQRAARSGMSLIDVTKHMDQTDADNYKHFMRAVNEGIQDFGTSSKGAFLRRNKFTRGLSTKIAVTLVALATVRQGLKWMDDMTTDPIGRPGKGSFFDQLFNRADAVGMIGQTKPDGSGTVGFEGVISVVADFVRLTTGIDKADIGVIARQINKRTQTEVITNQKLIGTKADMKTTKDLITDVGAGFVFDDSNAYLQMGSVGGVTFRKGDKGFRSSAYFQVQSAGQDISTAAYSMASKFYHKTIAGQGVEISNIIDASTRLIKDDKSVANLNRTAVLIRNATSMQHPLQNIRKVTRSKGSIKGDRLANLILAAREEAGRQLNRQSIASIYTENFYNQTDLFKNQVSGNFFRQFMNSAAIGGKAADALLGEILSGTFGYNPGQRNVVTNILFFSGGIGSKMKKNQKGENLIVDELEGVDLAYQNESFDQSRSTIAEYVNSGITALTDNALLNFMPDFVKKTAGYVIGGVGVFSILSSLGSYQAGAQVADEIASIDVGKSSLQFTAHYDDGRSVNASKEMVQKMNAAKSQMGETAYKLSESRALGTSQIKLQYINDGSNVMDYVTEALSKPENAGKSVNQIISERTQFSKETLTGNRAVITASDLNTNTSYRFQLAESIAFVDDGQKALDTITETLRQNANYKIIGSADESPNFLRYLKDSTKPNIETAIRNGEIAGIAKNADLKTAFQGIKNSKDAIKTTQDMKRIINQRINRTYDEMISNLFGGGMRDDGTIDFTRNRFAQTIDATLPTVDGTGIKTKLTVYELTNGTFSDNDIINQLRHDFGENNSLGKRLLQRYANLDGIGDLDNIETLNNLLENTSSLDDISNAHQDIITEARQRRVAYLLEGDTANVVDVSGPRPRGTRQIQQEIQKAISDKLSDLGFEIRVNSRSQTEVVVNSLKKGIHSTDNVVLSAGMKGFDEVMLQVEHTTNMVLAEIEANSPLQANARNMAILRPENFNQAGFVQRTIDKVKGRQASSGMAGAVDDVAQFRTPKMRVSGLSGALAGLPVALEAASVVIDSVSAVNTYGAYMRYAEALTDQTMTRQDEIMAQRELGMAVMKSGAAILMSIAQMKGLGLLGKAWQKMKMTIPKAIGATLLAGLFGKMFGGALYKNTVKPVLKAAKVIENEHGFMDKTAKAFNKTWNATVDAAGWAVGLPVTLVNKYGVQMFGEETGKKATQATASGLGSLIGTGTVVAGVAVGGGAIASVLTGGAAIFGGASAGAAVAAGAAASAATVGAVLTAPVTLAILGIALAGGAVAGWVFGDQLTTASTKLLRQIPKIPYIGGLLSGMIDSPYRAVRSQERFKHHYRHSPFTVGYAGDIVNNKWMAMLGAVDDPTGADLVSNMFGEIIRPTEYQTSAWKINSSDYGSNPIPIVDGVIERELRIRAQTYSDNVLGQYQWNQILRNADQSDTIKKQIRNQKAKEIEQLRKARQQTLKAAQGGGATSVPNHPGGTNAAQNNLTRDMVAKSEELKEEVLAKGEEELKKQGSTTFTVVTDISEVSNVEEQFTEDNLNITINGGSKKTKIPGIKKKLIIAGAIAPALPILAPVITITNTVDAASGIVRDATVETVTEGQDPSPEQYSQGRIAVMNALYT